MSHPAHPQAMAPARPGGTRTAPPIRAPKFPLRGRYASYTLFGLCSIFFLLQSLLVLEAVWQLGSGAEAWEALRARFRAPLYLVYHGLALVALVYTGIRFFLKLFAKSQPPKIGPLPRPPLAVFPPLLAGAWVAASTAVLAVLWGLWP